MKLISTLAIILVLTVSGFSQINQDSLMNAFIPEKKTAIVYLNKTIKLNSNDSINPDFELTEGTRMLFEYEFRSKDMIAMSDDEMVERLVFSVNANRKSFDFTDLELTDTRMLFTQSCFCMDAGNYVIKSGKITGKKTNANTWKVKIKINYIARNSGIKTSKTLNLVYKIK